MTHQENPKNWSLFHRRAWVVYLRFFLKYTLKEIATQLGCSRERVRQIEVIGIKLMSNGSPPTKKEAFESMLKTWFEEHKDDLPFLPSIPAIERPHHA